MLKKLRNWGNELIALESKYFYLSWSYSERWVHIDQKILLREKAHKLESQQKRKAGEDRATSRHNDSTAAALMFFGGIALIGGLAIDGLTVFAGLGLAGVVAGVFMKNRA